MAKFTGVVAKIYDKTWDDGGKSYSVKLEGSPLYFRCGKKRHAGILEPGNTVDIFAEQTDEKSAKVTSDPVLAKGAPKAETATAAVASAPAKASVDWEAKDRSIQYQSSRKDALELVGMLITSGAVVLPAAAAKKLAAVEAMVDKYTASFYADISVQGAVSRAVPAEAPKPVKPAKEEEDNPEEDDE